MICLSIHLQSLSSINHNIIELLLYSAVTINFGGRGTVNALRSFSLLLWASLSNRILPVQKIVETPLKSFTTIFPSCNLDDIQHLKLTRKSTLETSEAVLFSVHCASAMAEHVKDEKIMEPYLYLGQILGKNVRGILIDCFQEWISIPEEKMEIIKVSFTAI